MRGRARVISCDINSVFNLVKKLVLINIVIPIRVAEIVIAV